MSPPFVIASTRMVFRSFQYSKKLSYSQFFNSIHGPSLKTRQPFVARQLASTTSGFDDNQSKGKYINKVDDLIKQNDALAADKCTTTIGLANSSSTGLKSPDEIFVEKIVDYLVKSGGESDLNRIGDILSREKPAQAPKLKNFIASHPNLFLLSESKVKNTFKYKVHLKNDNKTAETSTIIDQKTTTLIDTPEALDDFSSSEVFFKEEKFIAVDCEGVPEHLDLIQVATTKSVYIFDCVSLGVDRVCQALKPFLESESTIKLMHDLHCDAIAFFKHSKITLKGVLDTQLVAEFLWGEMFMGMNQFLHKLSLPSHSMKFAMGRQMDNDEKFWKHRPLSQGHLEYAALDVSLLLKSAESLHSLLCSTDMDRLLDASMQRVCDSISCGEKRPVCFNLENKYAIGSKELHGQNLSNVFDGKPLLTQVDLVDVISLLPKTWTHKIFSFEEIPSQGAHSETLGLDRLHEITLDIGRRPQCWIDHKRFFLSDDTSALVNHNDIQKICKQLGEFGGDNRAGIDGKLHRFSAMRDRNHNKILGITIRIGRNVLGNADMISDLILGSKKSILILGSPGAGKTSIVRDISRKLSETDNNVVIVDTSNEIAGDGSVPHSCIGFSRRMMVPSLDKQGAVMIECVQNHTPHTMVIDEIGRTKEVDVARTVKQRGVRLIASAHGDLRSLVKNRDLRGLVGGVENVTLGDVLALAASRGQSQDRGAKDPANFRVRKTKQERGGEPTFDTIIEVSRDNRDEWRVVVDTAKAVDNILEGRKYLVQERTRDVETGNMWVELKKV